MVVLITMVLQGRELSHLVLTSVYNNIKYQIMKNIISKIIHIKRLVLIPVLIIALFITACENIIDLSPYSSISETTAYSTPSLVELSVVGMYNGAQRGYYPANGTGRGYPFGAAFVEQGDCRGEDAVNLQAFYQFTYEGTYTASTANNEAYWSDTYRLINRANMVIDGVNTAVTKNVITAAVGNQYLGEAYFMRAIAHLELLFHFARPYKETSNASHPGVPYRTKAYTTQVAIDDGTTQSRNTVAECYAKILEDLNFAETNLPGKSGRSGNSKVVRATKGAAIAFKTRVYQHMWDWANVIAETDKLKALPATDGYALTAAPDGPFASNYGNTESIFSVENSATNNPTTNGSLPQMYNGRGRALVCMSPIIWRNPSWLTDDKRRGAGMAYTFSGMVFTDKYKDYTNFTDGAPVIRYAEVLLNVAEAYARRNAAGDMALALTNLNLVRNRALATPATQAYTLAGFADNTALLNAILVERRIEFAMEGRRWPDIHRLMLDIPAKLSNSNPPASAFTLGTPYSGPYGVVSVPYANYKFLWPIPQIEINANKVLAAEQNPGW
jgi:starch-binding outer membrane protein, SusD/RagB family